MFEKRLRQASKADKAMAYYKDVYGFTDDQIQRLDIDVYSDAIMEIISSMLNPEIDLTVREEEPDKDVIDVSVEETEITKTAVKNDDVEKAMMEDPRIIRSREGDRKIYADGTLCRNDILSQYGPVREWDAIFSDIYHKYANEFSRDSQYFRVDPNTRDLRGSDGTLYIQGQNNSRLQREIENASKDPNARVYADSDDDIRNAAKNDLVITDDFYRFLIGFDSDWPFCRGQFSRWMKIAKQNGNL